MRGCACFNVGLEWDYFWVIFDIDQMKINNLVELNNLRTASKLGNSQIKKLIEELESKILDAD